MARWMDDLPEDKDPKRNIVVVVLAVVSLLAIGWGLTPKKTTVERDPPPSTDVYRAAFEEVASAAYDGDDLVITVDSRWTHLTRGEATERVVQLMERTGSFQWARIVLKDTEGGMIGSVQPDGEISWLRAPPLDQPKD